MFNTGNYSGAAPKRCHLLCGPINDNAKINSNDTLEFGRLMFKTITIQIVDDESRTREIGRKYLEREGFRTVEAATGPQALQQFHEINPDLVILDIMLPDIDGFTITRTLRETSTFTPKVQNIPIIILTSRAEEVDRVLGFELGVDDYVVKPFSPRELVGRVKAVLRRSLPGDRHEEKPILFAQVCLDPLGMTLLLVQNQIPITAKDLHLLCLLS